MKFFSTLITLPLLSLIFANPVPNPESAELAVRAAEDSLAARTFFEHDWRCGNLLAKLACKKKGGEWACDKYCKCVEKPVECPEYCPLREHKKKACELKKGWDWNDDKCACDNKCPNADWLSAKCKKDQGSWNLDKCACEAAKCPDCEDKGKECTGKGGSWDEHKCYCTPKKEEPKKECGDWWKVWLCKLKGKGCDYQCNCS